MSPELPKAVDALAPVMKEALGEASLAQSAPQNTSAMAGIIEGGAGKPDVAAAIEQHRADGPAFDTMRHEYAGAVTAARGIVEPETAAPAATAGANTEGGSTTPAAPAVSAVSGPATGNAFVMPNGPTGAEGTGPQPPAAPPQA